MKSFDEVTDDIQMRVRRIFRERYEGYEQKYSLGKSIKVSFAFSELHSCTTTWKIVYE